MKSILLLSLLITTNLKAQDIQLPLPRIDVANPVSKIFGKKSDSAKNYNGLAYQARINNVDGTVTLIAPIFWVNGKSYLIDQNSDVAGICHNLPAWIGKSSSGRLTTSQHVSDFFWGWRKQMYINHFGQAVLIQNSGARVDQVVCYLE